MVAFCVATRRTALPQIPLIPLYISLFRSLIHGSLYPPMDNSIIQSKSYIC